MFTKQFLTDAGERALATFLQTLLAVVGADTLNILAIDWRAALVAAGSATILSLVKSFGGAKIGNPGTASLTKATIPAPQAPKPDPVGDVLAGAQEALDFARKLRE